MKDPIATHHVRDGVATVRATLAGANIEIHENGSITVELSDLEWRRTARAVLKECNAAEHKLPSDVVVDRVRRVLEDAALRAIEAEDERVAELRLASTILHRMGDLIQAGTVTHCSVHWPFTDARHLVGVSFRVAGELAHVVVELGRGLVAVKCAR